ncbi:MAG: PrsW family intramembrane metalloprotease [Bacteroidales bacterium]|nr:PrsW family intramembrane metalloprotease [Bacteroidales bacterium]
MKLIILILTTFVSCMVLYFVYKKDPKKEPIKLIAKVFGLGALAVVPAFLTRLIVERFCLPTLVTYNSFFEDFVSAGFIEEIYKWAVVMLFIWRSKDYDDFFDGIVYCASAALGFAVVENIVYLFYNRVEISVLRMFFVGHFIFSVFMGIFLSQAKHCFYAGKHASKRKYLALSFVVPAVLHGIDDFWLGSVRSGLLTLILFAVFYIMVAAAAYFIIREEAANDRSLKYDTATNALNG